MSTVTQPHRLIVLLAALVSFGPISIDMYLPSLPDIGRDLQASENQVQLTIGVFLAGLSLGMLFYGALSDRLGRRRLLLGGIFLYLIATLGCALASQIEALIAWRFLQALGGAAASVLARVIVRDLFSLSESARILSLMHVVTMTATLASPLIGSYLMLLSGWRSLFYFLLASSAICLLATAWKIPETHPQTARSNSVGSVLLGYLQMLQEPKALGYMLCMGICFGGMFAFITASPFVYIEHFGVSPQAYSWLFSLNIAAIIVITMINARLIPRIGPMRLLVQAARIAALSGLLLILCGISSWGRLPALVVGSALLIGITGILGTNCLACLMADYQHQAGTAAGLAVAIQFILGTAFSALVSALHDGTAMPMMLIMGLSGILSMFCLGLVTRTRASASSASA